MRRGFCVIKYDLSLEINSGSVYKFIFLFVKNHNLPNDLSHDG